MDAQLFGLIDRERLVAFNALAGSRRALLAAPTTLDGDGVAWRWVRVGDTAVGLTWLGPGDVWRPLPAGDPDGEKYAVRRDKMRSAEPATHDRRFAKCLGRLRLGRQIERIAWSVHLAFLEQRRSTVILADTRLAANVWGRDRATWPTHWRADLLAGFRALSWFHLADWSEDRPPAFGPATAMFLDAADQRGYGGRDCPDGCAGGPKHHHFAVELGAGFLGLLEQFAHPTAALGDRTYDFSAGGRAANRDRPTLKSAGKTGRLVSAFVPALLGDPARCRKIPADQHRLLQAVAREITRGRSGGGAAVFTGDRVPGFGGRGEVTVPGLSGDGRHVTFGGNGGRPGQGYRLWTDGGWATKAGAGATAGPTLLDAAAGLAAELGLVFAGVGPTGAVHDLTRMRALARSVGGRRTLAALHVRAYAEAGFEHRWATYFGWRCGGDAEPVGADLTALRLALQGSGLTQRALARGVTTDPSFVAKILAGKKPPPAGWVERAIRFVAAGRGGSSPSDDTDRETTAEAGPLGAALSYLARGWSIVPQAAGAKQPRVRWKQYQAERPDEATVREWWERWPNAGVALVLGPVSGVFVVDVDGPEAHAALVAKLGQEPTDGPKAISGSRKPHRYHLFFRHPAVATKAKVTPWLKSLEFRGHGGIVVVPPSLHNSGNRYEWAAGRSPFDLPLPPLPPAVLAALSSKPHPAPAKMAHGAASELPPELELAPSTRRFLSGVDAFGPNWNEKLFRAACDLTGRGVPVETATPLLLAGAKPVTAGDEQAVLATVASAFSKPRSPGRK